MRIQRRTLIQGAVYDTVTYKSKGKYRVQEDTMQRIDDAW